MIQRFVMRQLLYLGKMGLKRRYNKTILLLFPLLFREIIPGLYPIPDQRNEAIEPAFRVDLTRRMEVYNGQL
jgi:hypothetical protein